jgi:hypothetical protein
MSPFHRPFASRTAATLWLIGSFTSTATLATPATDAKALYRQELAVCASGASPQGSETCIKEAQAAYAQNRRGGFEDRNENYQRNALGRCDTLSGSDQVACLARVQCESQSTLSGSVNSGGTCRDWVTHSVIEPKKD